ncbi:MAG: phosphoribosylformylglycinamidine synthase [Burkholderiales bacterium]|nr:phosphoribosylformylglycinamidine synthase [Burkholderiales bacterium]
MLRLKGGAALSAFRLEKLLRSASAVVPRVTGIGAEFWHFVELARALGEDERGRHEHILRYGLPPLEGARGELVLVVPRFGTVSPWSSKATDIAWSCGLDAVRRIERGLAYHIETRGGASLAAAERGELAALLHDRMTEATLGAFDEAWRLFERHERRALGSVSLAGGAAPALARANREMGLALSEEEIAYLAAYYSRAGRDPTDAELVMFAQANSEHCRHKIFNARWVIDGRHEAQTLLDMIRATHERSPAGTLVAYADNAAVMEGAGVARFHPGAAGVYRHVDALTHTLMKVETHNHPTAISPFPGAATGSGGEIRDEGATGRGGRPKAGLTGFSVSNLEIPGFVQPWETVGAGRPSRIASPLAIMLEGPVGGASFNNEFGRPNLAGYFRTFEQRVDGIWRGYHKPIMIAGGIGSVCAGHVFKRPVPPGALLVQLGGPGMLIGLGGGAASSMASGANDEGLDYASVQRGNPEMQRRAQEVIDRCRELGEANPILSIHDVGAGGLANAVPELVHAAGCGAHVDLRAIPSEEPGMSPLEIWCNEAQERYVLAIAPEDLSRFRDLCERERCPFAVIGTVNGGGRLAVVDPDAGNAPVDMELAVLLGAPPRMTRRVSRIERVRTSFDRSGIDLREAAYRVLRLPAVADKTFLVTIGDRTVGGMTARDQMVGPWQVPVADVAVTLAGFGTYRGEAFAMGERAPLALVNPEASGRIAVGEAITNIAAAPVARLSDIKLSANWMAAAGHPGEDAALFDTVRAVARGLCPQLGISIPVGKDSLSMKTAWSERGEAREVVAPLSLVVSAFAPLADVRSTLTPQLLADRGETELLFVDLGGGQCRMGGSALAQVYGGLGESAPDVNTERLRAFFDAVQQLRAEGRLLAYHDRSDGGLFATVCEMMFAGRCGVELDISDLVSARSPLEVLFNEELGAVVQVRRGEASRAAQLVFTLAALRCHRIGSVTTEPRLLIRSGGAPLLDEARVELNRAWSETTWHMQRLRDNPACADEEFARIGDTADPGLHVALPREPAAGAPFVAAGVRPRVAILREQGVNGQTEMAAAFDRAGFEAVDVHMTDLVSGRATLAGFRGLAAGGGFSYGDVLGAGEGWAKSILFNARARDAFEAFTARSDSFALGVCNGCQMMANLRELIPGARSWPRFVRNRSEQFEARFVMVEIVRSPSLFFAGMAGGRLPVAVAHGEGRAEPAGAGEPLVALRYIDNRGAATETYPCNPNGSPGGVTGFTTPDGRFTIVIPHPERVFRAVQNSWYPREWGEDGPWLAMFRNARRWCG